MTEQIVERGSDENADDPPSEPDRPARNPARTAGGAIGIQLMYLADLSDREPSVHVDVEKAEAVARIGAYLAAFPLIREAVTRGEDESDPWLTDEEAARHAKCLSDKGAISSEFRKKLCRLEEHRLSHRQGGHRNSRRLTRRSTIDAVIEYGLEEAIARLRGRA